MPPRSTMGNGGGLFLGFDSQFPFVDLRVGESFDVPKALARGAQNTRRAIERRNPGVRFVATKLDKDTIRFTRVSFYGRNT